MLFIVELTHRDRGSMRREIVLAVNASHADGAIAGASKNFTKEQDAKKAKWDARQLKLPKEERGRSFEREVISQAKVLFSNVNLVGEE